MVVHHWSDDGMVMYHRRSLVYILISEQAVFLEQSSCKYIVVVVELEVEKTMIDNVTDLADTSLCPWPIFICKTEPIPLQSGCPLRGLLCRTISEQVRNWCGLEAGANCAANLAIGRQTPQEEGCWHNVWNSIVQTIFGEISSPVPRFKSKLG